MSTTPLVSTAAAQAAADYLKNHPAVVPQVQAPAESLKPHAQSALNRGFHIFGLQPRKKEPLAGSKGFKDAKSSLDALSVWDSIPLANIGIDLGSSDLCVLDFDKPESIPAWLNETRTYTVKTAKGVHVYFRGARKTTKLYVGDELVGDVKSEGGYVLAEGSRHPDGPVYTVIDDSPILPAPERLGELVRHDSDRVNASPDGPPIPYHSHDTELTRIAGVLRNAGFDVQKIEGHLIDVCEKRCENYGSDYREMCKKIAHSVGKKPVGEANPVILGGKPVGQDSFTSTSVAAVTSPIDWRTRFKTVGELQEGNVRMLIKGFLPEGTTFIGGLPGEGKTLLALSITKALTTADPFLGKFFVEEPTPVIYLIPESSSRAFRARCELFGIPNDENLFLCRTVSEGATLPLDDASLFEAVRKLKPVVILDTFIRFSEADDENDAAQNKKIVNDIVRLRQEGAVAVIGLHHAKKDIRQKGMSLESVLRGTGDIAASCDAAYGLLRDHLLYNNGAGPNEIEVSCVKPRDFSPPEPFRIAATRVPTEKEKQGKVVVGVKSVIEEYRDFIVVSEETSGQAMADKLLIYVENDPTMSLEELEKATGITTWNIRKALKDKGWSRGKGRYGGWKKETLAPPGSPGDPPKTESQPKPSPPTAQRKRGSKPPITLDLPGQVAQKPSASAQAQEPSF